MHNQTVTNQLIEKCARVAKYFPLTMQACFDNAGMNIEKQSPAGPYIAKFNPLYNNADAASLEADLMLNIIWNELSVQVGTMKAFYADHDGDKQQARRMATVLAASNMFNKEMHTIYPI